MEKFSSTMHSVGRMAKAVVAGPYAGAMYLTGIWTEATNFNDAVSNMTPNQWILFGVATLGGWGVTYAVRNRHDPQLELPKVGDPLVDDSDDTGAIT